jgi:hypothetical protein
MHAEPDAVRGATEILQKSARSEGPRGEPVLQLGRQYRKGQDTRVFTDGCGWQWDSREDG